MGYYFNKFSNDIRKINSGIRSYSDLLIEQSLQVWNIKSRVGLFFCSLMVSLGATYFLSPAEFSDAQQYTLFILIFAVFIDLIFLLSLYIAK